MLIERENNKILRRLFFNLSARVDLKNRKTLLICGLVWAAGVVAGTVLLWNYELRPGPIGTPVKRWPAESAIARDDERATLVMFAHPRCPCSRASIGELEILIARCPYRVTARVVFFKPLGSADEWAMTDLWEQAARIPAVTVMSDEAGIEAGRFHAQTSGITFLYDAQGALLFSGGITASRGHAGDNAGRDAIVSLLTGRVADRVENPAFGCSILDSQCSSAEEAGKCDR